MLADSYQRGSAAGVSGLVADLALITRPWGFPLREVQCPVRLVYGDRDSLTPTCVGKALAAEIEASYLTVMPNAGHLLLWKHWPDLLGALVRSVPQNHNGSPPEH